MRRLHLVWTSLLLSLVLSSCGFTLRGTAPLQKYPAIYLQGDAHSELLTQLGAQLQRSQVKLLDNQQADSPVFVLVEDSLKRRNLSLFTNGQVAEYELIYTLDYQLILPGQDPVPYRIELNRDYQDDPNRALAKSRELDLLLSELRSQAVSRILRQLSRL
jgi:LPS-assembly lipoprotein